MTVLSYGLFMAASLGVVWADKELKYVYFIVANFGKVGFWLGIVGFIMFLIIKRNRYILAIASILLSLTIIVGLMMFKPPPVWIVLPIILFLLGCIILMNSISNYKKVEVSRTNKT